MAPLAEALGVPVATLLRAVELDEGGWWVKRWEGMPWQAEEFLRDMCKGVRPEGDFWEKLGKRQGYMKEE